MWTWINLSFYPTRGLLHFQWFHFPRKCSWTLERGQADGFLWWAPKAARGLLCHGVRGAQSRGSGKASILYRDWSVSGNLQSQWVRRVQISVLLIWENRPHVTPSVDPCRTVMGPEARLTPRQTMSPLQGLARTGGQSTYKEPLPWLHNAFRTVLALTCVSSSYHFHFCQPKVSEQLFDDYLLFEWKSLWRQEPQLCPQKLMLTFLKQSSNGKIYSGFLQPVTSTILLITFLELVDFSSWPGPLWEDVYH